jgi:hypothetical protein
MHAKNLETLLDQATGTNSLMPQAKRLIELRHVLLEALPGPLAGLATVANYRQGKVIIFAANSAVAAKLKLLGPKLTDCFVRRGLQVTALEIEVQPRQGARPLGPKVAVLSDSARSSLMKISSQLPDSKLKTILSTLGRAKVSER